ncbi:MAG: hypothetical protein IPP71_08485 [Bacteroidetes bacterium]|nr:hypothetical protein [Bacteroidota bacterium]
MNNKSEFVKFFLEKYSVRENIKITENQKQKCEKNAFEKFLVVFDEVKYHPIKKPYHGWKTLKTVRLSKYRAILKNS